MADQAEEVSGGQFWALLVAPQAECLTVNHLGRDPGECVGRWGLPVKTGACPWPLPVVKTVTGHAGDVAGISHRCATGVWNDLAGVQTQLGCLRYCSLGDEMVHLNVSGVFVQTGVQCPVLHHCIQRL